MDRIHGLFEIHITVDISTGLYKLWEYTNNNKGVKLIMAVADEGLCKDQYMISKWKNGNFSDVVNRALEMELDMISMDIKPIRVKVESMAHNNGVPATTSDYESLSKSKEIMGRPYFEFHAKIELNSHTIKDLTTMLKGIRYTDTFVAHSINICGSKVPLLTIRVYNHGRDYAIHAKDIVLTQIKTMFKIIGNIQQEFSVFDTNEEMDKGWLI